MYATIAYTSVTFYKVPEHHGHVCLFGLQLDELPAAKNGPLPDGYGDVGRVVRQDYGGSDGGTHLR